MAQLIARAAAVVVVALALIGCSSSTGAADLDADLEDVVDESAPVVDSDGFTRTAGGYYLEGNNGVFQICFRLLEQDGEVLCVDKRGGSSGDEYVDLDRQGVEVVAEAGVTRSTGQVWLWRKFVSDEGLFLRVRPVADGEVLP